MEETAIISLVGDDDCLLELEDDFCPDERPLDDGLFEEVVEVLLDAEVLALAPEDPHSLLRAL